MAGHGDRLEATNSSTSEQGDKFYQKLRGSRRLIRIPGLESRSRERFPFLVPHLRSVGTCFKRRVIVLSLQTQSLLGAANGAISSLVLCAFAFKETDRPSKDHTFLT